MAKEVKVPKISEGVESATVTEVLVSEGDTIKEEQSIIAVETDKASVEVPSSDSGKVKEIKVKEGDEIKVGDVILTLEGEGEEGDEQEEEKDDEDEKEQKKDKEEVEKEDKEDKEKAEKEKKDKKEEEKAKEEGEQKDTEQEEEAEKKEDKEQKEEEKDTEKEQKEERAKKEEEEAKDEEKEEEDKEKEKADKEGEKEGKKEKEEGEETREEVHASPAVRRLARELGVNIQALNGSGPGGRITEEDVKSGRRKKAGGEKEGAASQPSLPDFSQWGQVERQDLSSIRKATARNTLASWQNIPHVTQFDEADVSGIEAYMEKMQGKAEEAGGKLTLTAVLLKVAANALQQFPKFNASIDLANEEVILKKYIHIGMAVDTEKGLLLPVIRDVNKKSIIELSVEITEVAEKAREGKLSPEEMQGGNFSISNLGGIGGTNFTPVVYHPQVAILGISRTTTKPVFIDGKFEPRQILPLSLSYDHRLIDGAEGAKFLKWICQALEDPYKALLGA